MSRRRLRLLAAAAPFAILAAPSHAQTITSEVTTPVTTSTANGGAAGDVTISPTGSVTLPSGSAVTIDSDNSVDNQGVISIEDADDAVGIRANPGVTSGVLNSGAISITESAALADTDNDGDLDGPLATGERRVGILIEGGAPFTGNINNQSGASITVEGNESAGIRTAGQLDGNLTSSDGITVLGDDSFGIDIQNGVTGDINLDGATTARGSNAAGVSVMGDVGGALDIGGSVLSSGFRETSRRSTADSRALLDADDLINAGPALAVGGSLGEGLLIDGPVDSSDNTPSGTVQQIGSGPAVLISAAWDAARATDVVVSPVTGSTYGLVNRGLINASGVNDGFSATALRIEGSGGLNAIVDGGILVGGGITASAFDADSMAIDIRDGGSTPTLDVSADASVTATAESSGNDSATAINVAAGGSLPQIINDGRIIASVNDGPGATTAILDASGTLLLVENAGAIRAVNALAADSTDTPGDQVAIDLSTATADAVVRQLQRSADATAPDIRGDIRFGSGADLLDIQSGAVDGDVAFGDGADQIRITGSGSLSGALSDSDGLLVVYVEDGTLSLENTGDLNISELTVGADGQLEFVVDATSGTTVAPRLVVAGDATLADGAALAPRLLGISTTAQSFEIINAANLVAPADIADIVSTNIPYLYEAELVRDPGNANAVLLTLAPRSSTSLGMNTNQAAAYPAVLASLATNADVGTALANLSTEAEFFSAYNQLLPDYSSAALQLAAANLDSAVGAVGTRLNAVRAQREGETGVWVSEYGVYQDRDSDAASPGWRGQGFGLAAGVDRPFGPFYAVGANLAMAANQWEEREGFDDPVSVITAHFGAYAAAAFGNFLFDAYAGGGGDFYDSNRDVRFANLTRETSAEWSGYHANASMRASYEITSGPLIILPTVSIDYLRLEEDGYSESGGGAGIDLEVLDRTSDSTTATAMLVVGGRFNRTGRTWWSPRLRVGYRSALSSSAPVTMARFAGSTNYFTLMASDLPDSGAIAGFSFAAGSRHSSFVFDYDADIRDGFLGHVARVSFRFVF